MSQVYFPVLPPVKERGVVVGLIPDISAQKKLYQANKLAFPKDSNLLESAAMKKLVIAEKPSVAREIARTLGARERRPGSIEGDGYIVTWALGHLVELCEPAHYSERWKRWSMKDLPMIPETLEERVIEDSKEQFDNIAALLKRPDVSSVVIATDAGREGELVARWILKLASYEGPAERLWISSQTEKAIRDGFASLRPASDYDNLFHAAECRSAADWYVGMNVTRALTCHHDAKLSAGRVQTPTLALMTKREDEIEAFLGSFYYTARADFGLFSASYYPEEGSVRFQDEALKKEFEGSFIGRDGVVSSIVTEEKEEKAPLAYDLTELQRDANLMLGFSAKETLDTLQRLYEVHKIVTYPRTDSRYISSDIVATLPDRLRALHDTEFSLVSDEYLANGCTYEADRFVRDELVSDHHAIIPTEQKVDMGALSADEAKLFRLIAMRFLEVLSPSYRYKTTTVTIDVDGRLFKTRLSQPITQGFRSVSIALNTRSAAAVVDEGDGDSLLLRLKEGDAVKVEGIRVRQSATTPPERYTEASLLAAMEHAGRFVDDIELKGNLTSGLGTPATRADIIEKLIANNYVERDGRHLVPTPKGREVVRLAPAVLASPELTGRWEGRLEAISRGAEDPDAFICDIKKMARDLVDEVSRSSLVFSPKLVGARECPWCHGPMMRVMAKDGSIHHICQRLSCSYEEKEVRTPIETGAAATSRSKSVVGADGKVRVVLKKSAPKLPKAYDISYEVVKESKLSHRTPRNEKRFASDNRHEASRPRQDDFSGGTFADFFRQSEERRKRDEERRGKRK